MFTKAQNSATDSCSIADCNASSRTSLRVRFYKHNLEFKQKSLVEKYTISKAAKTCTCKKTVQFATQQSALNSMINDDYSTSLLHKFLLFKADWEILEVLKTTKQEKIKLELASLEVSSVRISHFFPPRFPSARNTLNVSLCSLSFARSTVLIFLSFASPSYPFLMVNFS